MSVYRRAVQPRLLSFSMRDRTTAETRRRVCAGLRGDVVEIGFGSGLNLPHIPAGVTGIWAVEPSEVAIRMAAGRLAGSSVPVVVGGADAQRMPFADDRFDSALCTWVMCGVPDPGAMLREVSRVLRPGGALHFVEHGLAPDPAVVRWQRRLNSVNRAVAGCLLDIDVRSLLEASPLEVTSLDVYYEKASPKFTGSLFEGRAVSPRGPV